jgi:predicted enzyme related to lactoylglutathione lyase
VRASADFCGRVLGFRQLQTVPCESETSLRPLAFTVDDADEAQRRLESQGVKITFRPPTCRTWAAGCCCSWTPTGSPWSCARS